ncbi:hypothetical protein JTE90_027854 [Oedothorax gibbosus]|uniref:Inosine/uridine-preferring nucleoside hydrolase domain-containing protein n=1 Tax=Oedothorax gibbosus TaxID=931172 RepID=A0AAV6U8A7_9ARAC|nr:hypothetical protein JTE90_027854 [Oedothorax gibbosus]
MTSPVVQLIVDSDCGSDDAMALMLALGGERADRVMAVTCCYGNTTVDHVRDNVRRVLTVCGRTEIPVYSGSSHPLERSDPDPIAVRSSVAVHGSDGFGERSHLFPIGGADNSKEENAVDFLVRVARERPGEVTVVALAPLTNLAAAHRKDPTFTEGLREIVILGGNYTGLGNVTVSAEFNFFSDPKSAHIVLTESRCPIRMVPWETCLENGMEWDDFYALVNSPGPKAELIRGATSIVSKFCKDEGDPAFLDCDVLALVAGLWPECVAETNTLIRKMGVCCEGGRRGMCLIEEEGDEVGGVSVELILKFRVDMLKDLRKDMIAERHR